MVCPPIHGGRFRVFRPLKEADFPRSAVSNLEQNFSRALETKSSAVNLEIEGQRCGEAAVCGLGA